VLVLEEVIPLIVLYAPGMLPSTCLLASQRERIEAKRYEKQRAYAKEMRDTFLEVRKAGATALASSLPSINSGVGLCGQVNFEPCNESRAILNYSSLRSVLSLSTWGPNFLRRWRIERHLKSVVVDDELLTKEGMGDRLTQPELREALWERGMYVFLGGPSVAQADF
jgi:LETM1 and EF-hand domain-containing protein 1